MPMTPQSALAWLVDEAQTILTSLAQALEDVKGALDTSKTEQCASLLGECEEKIHSIEGAFSVADSQALTQYASTLSQVLKYWRESKNELTIDSIAQVQMACWSLYDFLKIAKDRSDYSELSLFLPYQQLGGLLQANHHPIQLWGDSAIQSALAAWAQSNATESLLKKMTGLPQRATSANDLNDQVDTAMLGLIRNKSADAAAQLQALCSQRIETHTTPNQILFSTTLTAIAQAVSQQHLNLDIFLKRYLLGCMAWLKGEASDEPRLLSEAAFFCYLAWQKTQPTAPDDLTLFAQLAAWSPALATSYEVMHFRPEVRSHMLLAHGSIETSQKLWGAFCTSDTASVSTVQLVDLSSAFNAMGACLDRLHPAAYALNQSMQKMLSDAAQRKNRDMQVEVASTLLMLSSLTADATSGDDLKMEQCFDDLNRRLNAVSKGQTAGAFEPWMAELQQRKNWASAMNSSVEHLTHKLGEVENIFNHLWEHPDETAALAVVPEKLQQISSVALSLGLNRFAAAVDLVNAKVTKLANKNTPMEQQPSREQVTADLAALGLMLSMGHHDTLLPVIEGMPEDEDEPMLDIFLEEAKEVIQAGQLAIDSLSHSPADQDALDTLTRSFHTLKGSARIVGLSEFGEAAWLMEKHLNDRLPDGLSIFAPSLQLCTRQLSVMKDWTHQLQEQKTIDATDIDWGLEALTQEIQELNQPVQIEPQQMPSFVLPPADFLDLPTAMPLPEAIPLPEAEIQFKTVGDLQISIPLYQAYLNETDEWSRQLALALSEWAIDDRQPIPSQAAAWSHALSGSSATIGFASCAHLAKLVERLIEKMQTQNFVHSNLAKDLSLAADDIRRLLHQFAAGFVKESEPHLLARIEDYLAMPVPVPVAVPAAESVQIQAAPDAEMLDIFQEESEQLIPELGAALRAWKRAPDQQEHKTQALRALHTLKGSARLVGKHVLAQKTHDLESQIEAIGGAPSAVHLSKLLESYDQLLTEPKRPLSVAAQPTSSAFAAVEPLRVPVVATASSVETIRIQSSIIDRLVNQTGEIMTARARMETEMSRSLRTLSDLGTHVQRLRDQLRELELQTESQMQSRQAQVSDAANVFDPLELDRFTRTQELTRFMAEALSDVSSMQRGLQRSLNTTEDDLAAQLRQTRDLQRHLLRTRMVEFESINERLHRLVRMTSQELGKSIELTVQNSAQEIDRSVLERVLPAFEHILRNAVVHGIESPKERDAKGKPQQGKINIELSQQSNDVMVVLRDDGRGLDKDTLIAKAKKLQPTLDPNIDPTELIFMSGLSTAVQVSELAGRGIGLDVVRAQVQALGGRVQVQFAKDTGTAFKLILPLTMAVTQIVLVRTATVQTGIPSNLVVNVVRAKVQEVMDAYASGEFKNGTQAYPFYGLNQLLKYNASVIDSDQSTLPVMLLQSAGQMVAVHVDEVLGNQEVMIKNLGTQLAQMPALSGMTVLPAGEIVLIYNPVALAAVYGAKPETTLITALAEPPVRIDIKVEKVSPLVLVVDDSITMRRVFQRLLQREGYRVALAADGKQALESLRLEKPVLMISDVEMPRMDGFELLQNVRASDRLRDMPVVMITSRIADKHREHAKTLGANEYLGKPYSEDELIAVLTKYATK